MQKVASLLLSLLLLTTMSGHQPAAKSKVNWLTLEEMHTAYAREPKPILVDVYTGWCGWCKVMDRETYSNPAVADYINAHFYPVKLDAESKTDFVWNGKTYAYNKPYKTNDLAIWMLYGQMSYPSTVFFSRLDAQPAPLAGYLKPAELEAPVKYFGEGAWASQKYPDFIQTFKGSWK